MYKRRRYASLAALTAVALLISGAIYLGVGALPGRAAARPPAAPAAVWVGTWSAPPVEAAADGDPGGGDPREPGARTVRNVVHTSIGGTAARLTLSNLLGRRPLTVAQVSLALRAGSGADAVPGTLRRVTFHGLRRVTIAPGGQSVSDPVVLKIPYDGDLLVSVATHGGPVTVHPRARQTSYVADGDRTQDVGGEAYASRIHTWRHLTAVDVLTREADGAVVAIGDSITDGTTATSDANRRWPDVLADLLERRGTPHYGVLNAGIGGNRLLEGGRGPTALARFDRDVLARPGVRTVIVAIGINDLLRAPRTATADRITAGFAELTRRAHARGLRVVGATLLPCGGYRGCTRSVQAVREEVNGAVRGGGVFDGVVDFDRALRDPYAPGRLKTAYDSGDHVHPSDAGYARMGGAVDLAGL
ncbi:SGNH/GDSL hydrolase family protein [Streptomyces sp. SLBN-118]|uniref:SGNH/GDSL hydrolase family protein n=1 Tax=Streptomyces sp. SLBN-118 TaxID=2768454 RepID=UPI001153A0C4|nr:SGNH/GDSL hydrolase family protein [Streptomyces sp. SLBN-118]